MRAGRPHLLHIFPSFDVGGQQARLAVLANQLGDRYRHTILALDGAFGCAARLSPAVDHELATPGSLPRPLPQRLLAIRRRLARIRPDLLLTYNWGSIEWALANRLLPVCRHLHFEDGFGPEERDRQLRRRVLTRRVALSGRSTVVVPSRTLARLASECWRLSPQRVLQLPNGIDCGRFERALEPGGRERLVGSAGSLIVGTVAVLRPEKNLARLLRAMAPLFARLDVRLAIVGDGPERPALAQLARALGIADRVAFAGAVGDPERVLPHFDVFAMSSDTEQMPLTLMEAMAAARPVAAVDVGDIRQMLPEAGRAFVVPPGDEAALGAAIATLLGDAERRAALGRLNRDHARARFSLGAMVDGYEALLSAPDPRSRRASYHSTPSHSCSA